MGGTQKPNLVAQRTMSPASWNFFLGWTALWWGVVPIYGALFFLGHIEFTTSAKLGLYGVSVWLNACLLPYFGLDGSGSAKNSRLQRYHDTLCVWLLSYALTNAMWEIPWVLCSFSPSVFPSKLTTLDQVLEQVPWIRSDIRNMYYWVLTSFSAVDLRTVNGSGTFLSLECFCFWSVLSTVAFFELNRRRNPWRYAIPLFGSGIPIAATFIFTFSEVFDGCANMPGDMADTLLALVWTQYQYFFFPMLTGYLSTVLFAADIASIKMDHFD